MSEQKKLSKNKPRDLIEDRAWYYVNYGSVDLVTRSPHGHSVITRLTRKMLARMVAELKPLPVRKGR